MTIILLVVVAIILGGLIAYIVIKSRQLKWVITNQKGMVRWIEAESLKYRINIAFKSVIALIVILAIFVFIALSAELLGNLLME